MWTILRYFFVAFNFNVCHTKFNNIYCLPRFSFSLLLHWMRTFNALLMATRHWNICGNFSTMYISIILLRTINTVIWFKIGMAKKTTICNSSILWDTSVILRLVLTLLVSHTYCWSNFLAQNNKFNRKMMINSFFIAIIIIICNCEEVKNKWELQKVLLLCTVCTRWLDKSHMCTYLVTTTSLRTCLLKRILSYR